MKELKIPLNRRDLNRLAAGEEVLLTGRVYTARDQAHRLLFTEITRAENEGRPPVFPFPVAGEIIYYTGPTPPPPGKIIGSIGPTTSKRMDPYTPALLKNGLQGMIGKGTRGQDVQKAVARYGAVYFITYGGCGALLATHVKRARIAAFPELGPEAVWELAVVDFPAVVGIDSHGRVFPQPRCHAPFSRAGLKHPPLQKQSDGCSTLSSGRKKED